MAVRICGTRNARRILGARDRIAPGDEGLARATDQADRPQGPCFVQVDMTYDFDLIVPFGLDFFGTHLGLPEHLSIERTSVFAISEFSVDG